MKAKLTVAAFFLIAFWSLGALSLAQPGGGALRLSIAKADPYGNITFQWNKPQNTSVKYYQLLQSVSPDSTNFTVVSDSIKGTYATINVVPAVNEAKIYHFMVQAITDSLVIKSNVIHIPVPPIPPINAFKLTARYNYWESEVSLHWDRLPVPVTSYKVLRAELPDSTNFTTLSTITDKNEYDDVLSLQPNETKVYIYRVEALVNGTTVGSNLAFVPVVGKILRDTITITSVPVLDATINTPYTYDVNASSSNPAATLKYVLMRAPFGMKIDATTGVISWTPQNRGIYDVRVSVFSTNGGEASQRFNVIIAGGNGLLSGTVTDSLGTPLKGVVIEALKVKDSGGSFFFRYHAVTNEFGQYNMRVIDPGTYTIKAQPIQSDYLPQWYNNKTNPKDADKVVVQDSASNPNPAPVNFVLKNRNFNTISFKVSGKISDSTGTVVPPLSGVEFIRADIALAGGSNISQDSFGDDFKDFLMFDLLGFGTNSGHLSKFVFRALPDSLGNYTVNLPVGKYIAFAKAPGFLHEFYNEKENILTADIITIDTVKSGVNFTLNSLPPIALGEISGMVADSVLGVGVKARIIAHRDVWNHKDNFGHFRTYTTETDSLGNYILKDLVPGKYILLAIPQTGYAPSFYKDAGAAYSWHDATKIEVNGTSVSGINFYPAPIITIGGNSAIAGTISGLGLTDAPASGVVGGAMVFAFDSNNNVAGFGVSDNSGNYTIKGLTPGSYKVSADAPGYNKGTSTSASVSYDAVGNPVTTTTNLSISGVLGNDGGNVSNSPNTFAMEQNFPNPFNPSTTISYTMAQSSNVTLKIYNVIGQLVETLVDSYQEAGSYSISFNATSLSSGVYFYRLEAQGAVVTKKMTLLK